MGRQRLRSRTSPLAFVGRVLVVLLALALVWYGLMLVLLALGVSAGTVDLISGYRTVFNAVSDLKGSNLSDPARVIAAIAGLVAFLLFGYLALKEIPRPYLARQDLELPQAGHGTVTVEPRAVERLAELAATRHPAVTGAAGRFGTDELVVNVTVRRARDVAATLTSVQEEVEEALGRHGLPIVPVNLTLTGFERRTRRELD